MHKYKLIIPLIGLLLASSVFVAFSGFQTQQISDWDFPRLDTINMIEAYPWQTALEKAQAGVIDSFLGAVDPGSVQKLVNEGWTVTSSQGGFHLCRFSINCRGTTPSTSGKYMSYHGRTPGFSLYPLNLTGFRLALNYIHRDSAGGYKTTWCYDIFKYIVIRLDWAVTPAIAAWFNPYMTYYADSWETAEQILLDEGWTWDKGPDGIAHTGDDSWITPPPQRMVLWNGSRTTGPKSDRWAGDAYGIYVMCPGDPVAPTSNEITKRFIRAWNWFFTGEETLTGLFLHDPQATSSPLVYVMLYNRDHDINFLCLSLGRFPTYLWTIFNSEMDVEGGSNDAGLVNPSINRLTKTFFYCQFKDYQLLAWNIGDVPVKVIPAGTEYDLGDPTNVASVVISNCSTTPPLIGVNDVPLIIGTDYQIVDSKLRILQNINLGDGDSLEVLYNPGTYLEVLYPAADPAKDITLWNVSALAQKKLFYAAPWVSVYSRDYIDSFRPGLICWVDSKGYGAGTYSLIWTLCSMHWEGAPVNGTLNWHISGDVVSLNPIPARWVYEWAILNPTLDSLTNVNPYTHADMPWIAVKWKIEPWYCAAWNTTGAKYTFWIRNDVYWHDGFHVTSYDIKWNWDYITKLKIAKWADLWRYYQKGEVIGDYIVVAYTNRTAFWDIYTYSGLALIFPPQVWSKLTTLADATAFRPWAVSYKTHVGIDPPSGLPLTCLFGTGPFWLESWNEIDVAVLKRNENYFVRRATKLQGCNQMAGLTTCTSFAKYIAGTVDRTVETAPVTRTLETVERTLETPLGLLYDATAKVYYHVPMDTVSRTVWNNSVWNLTNIVNSLWNETTPQAANRWTVTNLNDKDSSGTVTTFDVLTMMNTTGETYDFRVDTIFFGAKSQLVLMQVIPNNPINTWWSSAAVTIRKMTNWTDKDESGDLTAGDYVLLGADWCNVKKVETYPTIGNARAWLTLFTPFQINPTSPITRWFEITPETRSAYDLWYWEDTDTSGNLTVSDQIKLVNLVTRVNETLHVEAVNFPWNITVKEKVFGNPVCTTWHEIAPDLSTLWHITAWTDTDASGSLTVSDEITLYGKLTGRTEKVHVDAIVTNPIYGVKQITVTRKTSDIPRDPLYIDWHELTPNYCHRWSLTGWTDVDLTGNLTAGDEIDMLHLASGIAYKFDVKTVTIGVNVTMIITEKVPGPMKIVRPFIDVVIINMNTKANCTFTWELYCGTTKIANGSLTLTPLETFKLIVPIPKPRDIPTCIHTWKLKVITTTGVNEYNLEMAYLVGDVNNDGKIDAKDIAIGIKDYGSYYVPPPTPSHPRWNEGRSDINGDNKVDAKDIGLLISMFGKSCFC